MSVQNGHYTVLKMGGRPRSHRHSVVQSPLGTSTCSDLPLAFLGLTTSLEIQEAPKLLKHHAFEDPGGLNCCHFCLCPYQRPTGHLQQCFVYMTLISHCGSWVLGNHNSADHNDWPTSWVLQSWSIKHTFWNIEQMIQKLHSRATCPFGEIITTPIETRAHRILQPSGPQKVTYPTHGSRTFNEGTVYRDVGGLREAPEAGNGGTPRDSTPHE